MSLLQTQWYVVCTRSRHERPVEQLLRHMGVQTYLPLRQTWSPRLDRRERIEAPALPGYLFAQCALHPELRSAIKRAPGVAGLLESAGRPCAIPEREIASLRIVLADEAAREHPYLRVGDRVHVMRGPFAGAVGYLTRVPSGDPHLVVAVEWVNRAVAVTIDIRCVEREERARP